MVTYFDNLCCFTYIRSWFVGFEIRAAMYVEQFYGVIFFFFLTFFSFNALIAHEFYPCLFLSFSFLVHLDKSVAVRISLSPVSLQNDCVCVSVNFTQILCKVR